MLESKNTLKSSLPVLSAVGTWSRSEWCSLGERLQEIGLKASNLKALDKLAPGQAPRLVAPLVRRFLRKQNQLFGHAARLFMFGDFLQPEEARAAFGNVLLGKMLDTGLIISGPDGALTSPFDLSLVRSMYIFSDHLRHGAEAVMGFGTTTGGLVSASYPTRRMKRALDLGCGAGALALTLSRRVDAVVATDINPRALSFGQMNAAINGIENVEFRLGDLFAPVVGDKFELIVSQPPFVPMPDGFAPTAYLFGGTRGDELSMRIVAAAPQHLTDNGRAVLMIQWPEISGESIPKRLRAALHVSDIDLLIISDPAIDLDRFAIAFCSFDRDEPKEPYEKLIVRWKDHFQAVRMRSMRRCVNVLRKRKGKQAWTKTVHSSTGNVRARDIEQLFRRYDLMVSGQEVILGSKLCIPAGAMVTSQNSLDGAAQKDLVFSLDERSMGRPARINSEMLNLLKMVHQADTVEEAIRTYAARERWNQKEAIRELLPAVEQALDLGMLEVLAPARARQRN